MRTVFATLLVLASIACGDDAEVDGDAGEDASADGSTMPPSPAAPPASPEPPNIPWLASGGPEIALPTFEPCPSGWVPVETESDGVTECLPWLPTASPCPAGEFRFVGDTACAPVGPACPSGAFPDDLPAGRTLIFVDDDATGGSGTRADPFERLSSAVTTATAGSTIVIASGTYSEFRMVIQDDIELLGACASGVRIVGDGLPVVLIDGDDVAVRRLTVADSAGGGFAVRGADARLEELIVENTASYAVLVRGGTATLRDVAAQNVAIEGAAALKIDTDGTLDVERLVVDGANGPGISTIGGTTTITRAHIRDLEQVDDAYTAIGIIGAGSATTSVTIEEVMVEGAAAGLALRLASASADRLVIRDVSSTGINLLDGSTATGRKVSIHDVESLGTSGDIATTLTLTDSALRGAVIGIGAASGADVRLTRVLVSGMVTGITAQQFNANITLADVRVVGAVDGTQHTGVYAGEGGRIVGERVSVSGTRFGISSGYADSLVDLEDVYVTETRGDPSTIAYGLLARGGATMEIDRALIEDFDDYGIRTFDDGHLTVRDAVVRRGSLGLAEALLDYGHRGAVGARVSRRSDGVLSRIDISETFVGFMVSTDGVLEARDLRFSEHRPGEGSEVVVSGAGFVAYGGAEATVDRIRIDDALDFGIAVQDGSLTASDVRIEGVTTQPGIAEPFGIAVLRSPLVLRRGHIEDVAGTGLFALDDATVDVEDLAISSISAADCGDCGGATTQGSAIVIGDYSAVALLRFHIFDSALCGVHFVSGDLDLATGIVEGHRIGACVEEPEYDLARLMNDVRFIDNEVNLETTSLPVPELPSMFIGQ